MEPVTSKAVCREREGGVAIIIALVFVVVVTGLVYGGTIMLEASTKRSEVRFRVQAQATQFARSGLTDTLNWMRRQSSQPVNEFIPVLDTLADPKILDTDDPDIGLVRQFEIQGNVWGRYEVWKKWDADPDFDRLEWRQLHECKDISAERGFTSTGNVWLLQSLGYVFLQRDPNLPYNTKPNQVVSSVVLGVEIRRLSLQPPTQTALSVRTGGSASVNYKGRIRGGGTGAGIYYPAGSGNPSTGPSNQKRVKGSPPLLSSSGYDDSIKKVFGVEAHELSAMADLVVTQANDFPDPIPQKSLVYCEVPSITFDATRPLNGTGVVYIKGNVTLVSGNNSIFSGLLYVDGNLTVREPSEINGSVVVTGTFTIQGSGDYATIRYDDDILSTLRIEIGQYRMSGGVRNLRDLDNR